MSTPPAADRHDRGRRILVFGASGTVGRALVPRLLAEGFAVRAAGRRTEVMAAEGWHGAEIVQADALDAGSLPAAFAGADTAFYLVHSMAAGKGFPDLERRAAGLIAEAAAAAGLRRLIYLGGLVPEAADSPHLLSRRDTGSILRDGPVPVVELRAGIIVGPGSAAFEVMRDLVAHLPAMLTPRWVRSASPPVALPDLIDDLVALIDLPDVEGRILDTAGPEMLSYEAMMRRLAPLLGRHPPLILPVPLLTPELSAYWLRFVTSTPASIATALIMGLKHDIPADPRPLLALRPGPRMDFEAAVRWTLAAERAIAVTDRWREGALSLRRGRHDVSFYGKRETVERRLPVPPGPLFAALEAGLARGWRLFSRRPPRRLVALPDRPGPGAAGLEITLAPEGGGTRLEAVLHWHPLGFKGILAWYLLRPWRRWRLERRLAAALQNIARSAPSSVG
jgi:uncharacterized protein YbjT (DUF2867 family)